MIGTGGLRHARDFVKEQQIPYPLLVDDDARAAEAVSVQRVGPLKLFDPASYPGSRRAWSAGHRIGIPGKRANQLGATFVVGPGSVLHYSHHDRHTADHAPMEAVLEALEP